MDFRVTSEERSIIKDEFMMENDPMIIEYSILLADYGDSFSTLTDRTRIESTIGYSIDRLESIAGSILFTLATMESKEIPLQSLAGQIAGFCAKTDSISNKTAAMHTALEILMIESDYTKISYSKNGNLMVKTLISNENLIHKNIVYPLTEPTSDHKLLGVYEWSLRNEEALDMLNNTAMKIIPITDTEPTQPFKNDFSESAKKEREQYSKWQWRQAIGSAYKNMPIYFNWASDYRGRMYPVGYYYNPQGNELEKNMLGFNRGERLNYHGVLQLKKSIASAYGLDKQSDLAKLQWFHRNEKVLHLRLRSASEPHTFEALMIAWKNYLSNEKSHIPVEIDATCSQAQCMAVLLKNRTIAETCNVVNVYDNEQRVKRMDLYDLVADRMSDIIAEQSK